MGMTMSETRRACSRAASTNPEITPLLVEPRGKPRMTLISGRHPSLAKDRAKRAVRGTPQLGVSSRRSFAVSSRRTRFARVPRASSVHV